MARGAFSPARAGVRRGGGWAPFPTWPIAPGGWGGRRPGGREVPSVKCPADPRAIAATLVTVEAGGRLVHLAPGLSYEDESGLPDVMRGEEVEILGVAHAGGRLIVLPGSHSKWAGFDRRRVTRFKTV